MNIIFAGTPTFAQIQLQALFNTHHEIMAVYTQPDKPKGRGQHLHQSPVKEIAAQQKIPVEQPQNFRLPETLARFARYQPDVLIVAAYGLILPQDMLTIPRFGCINVHASLLPRWRGAAPIQHAILAGDRQTGITLMQMDAGLDTGDILAQRSCLIDASDTAGSVHDKLAHLGALLLVEKLEEITSNPQPQPQDPRAATYAGKITKEQAHIDWSMSALDLAQTIKAFDPWPVAYSTIDNHVIRFWQAKAISLGSTAKPGTIIEHTDEGIVVATGNGALLLMMGQLPGKKILTFSEILNGHFSLFAQGRCFSYE